MFQKYVKTKIFFLFVMALVLFSAGCESVNRGCKSFKASTAGLERTVVWTGFDGSRKEWTGKFKIDSNEGSPAVYFIVDNKTVILGPGWYAEEK